MKVPKGNLHERPEPLFLAKDFIHRRPGDELDSLHVQDDMTGPATFRRVIQINEGAKTAIRPRLNPLEYLADRVTETDRVHFQRLDGDGAAVRVIEGDNKRERI